MEKNKINLKYSRFSPEKYYLVNNFILILKRLKLDNVFEAEVCLVPGRNFRCDFVDRSNKIVVEIEGGVWVRGRHVRGGGYIKDIEKYNILTCLGYRILRYANIEQMRQFEENYKQIVTGVNIK